MLRDMRSRFFNHGLGFIIVPLWPLVHMGLIILIHSYTKLTAPYGDSVAVFYMTGVLPFLAFSYVSRFMAYSLLTNKSMLAFPAVKMSDILTGRAALEMLASFVTALFITLILYLLGNEPFPTDLKSAAACYLTVLFLAYACGYLVGICSVLAPVVLTIYQLTLLALYVSSGVFFVASNLPDSISYYLSYNPICGCIEWLRTAYYENYSDQLISVPYILMYAAVTLLLGLMLERYVVRYHQDR